MPSSRAVRLMYGALAGIRSEVSSFFQVLEPATGMGCCLLLGRASSEADGRKATSHFHAPVPLCRKDKVTSVSPPTTMGRKVLTAALELALVPSSSRNTLPSGAPLRCHWLLALLRRTISQ